MGMARDIQSSRGPRHRGFTLIELMIVIVVLSIITVVAVASYGSSAVKARRGAAEACLMEAAQFMERHYTINMTYAGANPNLACSAEQADFYNFGFVGVPDATSYTLQATPIGAQLSGDTRCGVLTLDSAGVKAEGGTSDVEECW
jgi:type IV pilus assembly protein PilE